MFTPSGEFYLDNPTYYPELLQTESVKEISNIIKDTYKWLKINKSNLIKYF